MNDDAQIQELAAERDAVLIRDYTAALDVARFDLQDTVLDVGTGSGRMLAELVKRGYRVVSIDVDAQAFEKARGRLGELADRVEFVQTDARGLRFPDHTFRAATFANAVHEIQNPRKVIDEITRVLTKDGKLLLVEFNAAGFEMIEHHHRLEGKGDHPRGEMTTEDIDLYLRGLFDRVELHTLSVTNAWVVCGHRKTR